MTEKDALTLEDALEKFQKRGWISVAGQLIFLGVAYANIVNSVKHNADDIDELKTSHKELIVELKTTSKELRHSIVQDRWSRGDHNLYANGIEARLATLEARLMRLEKR